MAAPINLERFDVLPTPKPVAGEDELLGPPVSPPPEPDLAEQLEDPAPDPSREALELVRAAERTADQALAKMIAGARDALTEALDTLLPSLLADGLSAEIAMVAARIATDGPRAAISLNVSPTDHDTVVAALSEINPPNAVTVAEDPTLVAGTARLAWTGGGALIDMQHLLAEARDVLARRMKDITEGQNNERS